MAPSRSWIRRGLILWLLILTCAGAHASQKAPEKFVYDLTWTGIKVGTASLESICEGDEVKLVSMAGSSQWVSVLYTVDDRAVSILSMKNTRSPSGEPVKYRLVVREGRHKRDKEVVFDRNANKARYVDYLNNEKKEFDIPAPVFDPLSGFYYLRTLAFVVGKPVFVTIFDNRKVWNVEVRVLRKERVALPIGAFDTVVVKPLMKSEGIFYRKGDMLIWLTDDAKHIPVKMQTKVAVGYVTATLIKGIY